MITIAALAVSCLLFYRHATQTHDVPHFAGQLPEYLAQRAQVPCPAPGPDTLVLVGLGQSNAGNWGEVSAQPPQNHPDVLEFWQGHCYAATSPMLGGTGTGRALWPELGKSLVEAGVAKRVLVQIFAVHGASIQRFTHHNDLWPLWRRDLQGLLQRYPVGYYLWLQGEADFALGTSTENYVRMFTDLQRGIRELDPDARVFVPIQTYCADTARWTPDNAVSRAQAEMPKLFPGVLSGVHTDTLLAAPNTRWDGCHLSGPGYARWATAWTARIQQENAHPTRPTH